MRKILLCTVLLFVVALGSACSTTAHFRTPHNTTLKVSDRTVPSGTTEWRTSPFFWSAAGGIPYELYDSNGKLVRHGKLKSKFRVVSIFWPPLALIYWPMGMRDEYDLTHPGDGSRNVIDEGVAPAAVAPAAAPKKAAPAKKK